MENPFIAKRKANCEGLKLTDTNGTMVVESAGCNVMIVIKNPSTYSNCSLDGCLGP